MFSKSYEHGIKAVLYIATQSLNGRRVKIPEIAEKTGNPEAFTAKILGTLSKEKIVQSSKGPIGGFDIDIDKMKETKVIEIIYAIDGDKIFTKCALGLHKCSDINPCPLHTKFKKIKDEIKEIMCTTTLYDLALDFTNGKSIFIV
ncbi:MAG: hypothetical protein AMXMBFR79_17640 [Chitinophagaceae bacterium]|nr:Rrf2 family transcriptional regulator [Chitinophagaceae bacterium]MCZ2299552.1 Rrf2 family transcriptional regulator [Chitinophagales bacterium]